MEFTEFFQSIKTPATIAHIIAVIVGMGSALVSDGLFSFFARDKKLSAKEIKILEVLRALVLYGLVAIALSGIAIFLSDPDKYIHSEKFLAKMSILAVLLLNGYALNKYIWPHLLKKKFFTAKSERNVRRIAFACGSVSAISWLSVLGLGILDSAPVGYSAIMALYAAVILFGMTVALLIEKREYD